MRHHRRRLRRCSQVPGQRWTRYCRHRVSLNDAVLCGGETRNAATLTIAKNPEKHTSTENMVPWSLLYSTLEKGWRVATSLSTHCSPGPMESELRVFKRFLCQSTSIPRPPSPGLWCTTFSRPSLQTSSTGCQAWVVCKCSVGSSSSRSSRQTNTGQSTLTRLQWNLYNMENRRILHSNDRIHPERETTIRPGPIHFCRCVNLVAEKSVCPFESR